MNDRGQNQKRTIDLHIEELVLDGFPVQDESRIASAVQQELRRLLGEGSLPERLTQNGNIEQLDSGTIQIESGATAEATGYRIARSIYGGLKQ